jgi:esterase FrsA
MYTYDVDPQAMFDDRTHQFAAFGIPLADILAVRARVTDMWADRPGGWSHEWSALADTYSARGDHGLAAFAFGCAHFPCLNTAARVRAQSRQLEQYELAAADFPVTFERRLIEVPYRGERVEVPVHLYSPDRAYRCRPVLLAHGGVDTFKMDFHPFCVALTLGAGITTMAIDMPGTGETPVPLDATADEVIAGMVSHARSIGDGRVAHFGMSFGGNFSAMSGLTGLVDAAVDLGGPLVASFTAEHGATLPFGMRDIVGNAMHYDRSPTLDELVSGMRRLSRADLLAAQTNSPMLVINGADDYFVAESDTLVFEGRPDTEVHLLDGTGHCAVSRLPEVIAMITGWLRTQFAHAPTGRVVSG